MSILHRLRQGTHAAHTALEARVDLLSQIETPTRYRRLLEVFYGLYRPLEQEIQRGRTHLEKWLPDVEYRMRADALERDLLALGGDCPDLLPRAHVPGLISLPEQFGCLYVLEGSRLGAQVISREVQNHLGLDRQRGTQFFFGHGADTGKMWSVFRKALESYSATHIEEDCRVIAAAIETFRLFDEWIRKNL